MRRDWSPTRIRQSVAAGLLALAGLALLLDYVFAQQQQGPPLPTPRLTIVTPNGGKTGSTVEVVLTGADLDEPQALLFSHPGLKAELIPEPPPPPPDPKKGPAKPPPPQPPKFKVTIAGDVPLGIHDVRLANKWGVSNPRAFVVGDLSEVLEKEPNNDVDQAQKVDLNSTINGAITTPTDVDYFTFTGKKGQRVVVSCLASSIDSRLQAAIELYDKAGRLLGSNKNYQNQDALMDATLPADGDYLVRLYHFTHTAGNAEYFYRLSISTAPWIDAVFPPMVEPGKPAALTVYGRNLPGGQPDPSAVVDGRVLEKLQVTVNAPNDPAALQRLSYSGHLPPNASGLDGFEYRIKGAAGASNPFLLTFARAPVVLDNGNNDKPEQAQEVPVPCEVAGRIEKRRDQDWYSFTAKAGETYSIEVLSDRIGAPTYMEFALFNPANKQQLLYESPDNTDTLTPFKFSTRTADPARYQFKAPADGKYHILVKSQTGDTQAGPRHYYRLRIGPNQPDFRLILMSESGFNPDAFVVRQGSSQYFDVFVWRHDGFNGEIALSVDGLPAGVTCTPQTIGPGLRHAALSITAAPDAAVWTGEVKIKGTAKIDGKDVVREARAGSITWPVQPQQNIVTVSRMDRQVILGVREQAQFNLTASIDKMTVAQGDKITVALKATRMAPELKAPIVVTSAVPLPNNQPPFITFNNNQPVNIAATDAPAVLTIAPNAVPGTYTLVFRSVAQMPFTRDPSKQKPTNISIVSASTPVTFTVLPKDLATVTLTPPNATVKLGTQAEVVVRVARKYDFAGEFKVELVLPPNIKGISADPVTIPAGKDEAKLVVKVAPDAPGGNQPNLTVRATAMFIGNVPVVQEAKFAVNVTK
jgi:hypothetical protein